MKKQSEDCFHYSLSFFSLTTSFKVVANPAIPCNSLGIIILVASPLDKFSKALKPCKVT
jgi:hypothetical protein